MYDVSEQSSGFVFQRANSCYFMPFQYQGGSHSLSLIAGLYGQRRQCQYFLPAVFPRCGDSGGRHHRFQNPYFRQRIHRSSSGSGFARPVFRGHPRSSPEFLLYCLQENQAAASPCPQPDRKCPIFLSMVTDFSEESDTVSVRPFHEYEPERDGAIPVCQPIRPLPRPDGYEKGGSDSLEPQSLSFAVPRLRPLNVG